MFKLQRWIRYALPILIGVTILQWLTATAVVAGDGPPILIVPVVAPRNTPAPIPHTMVLDPATIDHHLQSGGLRPQSLEASASAAQQGVGGQPGVLQTTTDISSGLTLYDDAAACNDFNPQGQWQGQLWTMHFAEWGAFAADDGYYQAKNVTFDRELVIGPGNRYNRSNESSLKIASNQPYEAGVMSPAIEVTPGARVRVRVSYLIYNHGSPAESLDYASMGIIPKLGEKASYVSGYQRGEWATLEQEIEAIGDQVVVMLQAHSPAALNSNIYFDNVEIYRNGRRLSNCRR